MYCMYLYPAQTPDSPIVQRTRLPSLFPLSAAHLSPLSHLSPLICPPSILSTPIPQLSSEETMI